MFNMPLHRLGRVLGNAEGWWPSRVLQINPATLVMMHVFLTTLVAVFRIRMQSWLQPQIRFMR